MKITQLLVLSAAAALSACEGGSPTGSAGGKPGLAFLAGANATDSVGAVQVQALRVEVRGPDGKPAARAVLRADAVVTSNGWDAQPEVLPGKLGSTQYGASVSDTADADGIVHFQVKLGTRAGPARLVVTAPALGLQDTARFTVNPGGAHALTLLPADTVVRIGGSATLRGSVVDRFGNRRSEPVTYTSTGTGGSLSGAVFSGSGFGRARVVAEAGGKSDTSYVSVVPQGTVAAFSSPGHTGQAAAIYTFNLDGSEFREVRRTIVGNGYFGDMPVSWLGSGKLVYHDNNYNHTKQVYVHDLATGAAQRFLAAADQMEMENHPRASRDGSWVYFSGGTYSNWAIFRAKPDGTGKERISPASATKHWLPTASPDGTELAYVVNGDYSAGEIEVISLATRQVRKTGVRGTAPRWSPDGSWIAYVAQTDQYSSSTGTLSVMRPDGTERRALTRSTTQVYGGLDWSPDGKYVVSAVSGGKLIMVEVSTGTEVTVALPTSNGMIQSPVWKP